MSDLETLKKELSIARIIEESARQRLFMALTEVMEIERKIERIEVKSNNQSQDCGV